MRSAVQFASWPAYFDNSQIGIQIGTPKWSPNGTPHGTQIGTPNGPQLKYARNKGNRPFPSFPLRFLDSFRQSVLLSAFLPSSFLPLIQRLHHQLQLHQLHTGKLVEGPLRTRKGREGTWKSRNLGILRSGDLEIHKSGFQNIQK